MTHGTRMSKEPALFFKDYLDSHPVPTKAVAGHFRIDGERLERLDKVHLSWTRCAR